MKITRGNAIAAIALVLSATLATPLAVAQTGLEVIGFACDRNDAVVVLKVRAPAPGEYTIQWNNLAVCGRSA